MNQTEIVTTVLLLQIYGGSVAPWWPAQFLMRLAMAKLHSCCSFGSRYCHLCPGKKLLLSFN